MRCRNLRLLQELNSKRKAKGPNLAVLRTQRGIAKVSEMKEKRGLVAMEGHATVEYKREENRS
jgi:hypothetical protein